MNRKLLIACLTGFLSLFAGSSEAQVSVNINIGSQPLWGPVGYDHVDYYYLPDVDTYYYVPKRQYIYLQNDRWIFSTALPSRFAGYNLYNGYKVVLNTPQPWLSYKTHKVKYARYKGYKAKQPAIRYSNNPKYFIVKGHPKGVPPGQAKKVSSVKAKGSHGTGKGNKQGKGNKNNEKKGKGKH